MALDFAQHAEVVRCSRELCRTARALIEEARALVAEAKGEAVRPSVPPPATH